MDIYFIEFYEILLKNIDIFKFKLPSSKIQPWLQNIFSVKGFQKESDGDSEKIDDPYGQG